MFKSPLRNVQISITKCSNLSAKVCYFYYRPNNYAKFSCSVICIWNPTYHTAEGTSHCDTPSIHFHALFDFAFNVYFWPSSKVTTRHSQSKLCSFGLTKTFNILSEVTDSVTSWITYSYIRKCDTHRERMRIHSDIEILWFIVIFNFRGVL